ncbi:RloB domain-containing protein [Sphingomonas sp. PR090111-T3T-6A]|uniref:RloB domain-containing protein n=1 Tax=Sphingomonas sp. PR090111-T3T-6A TaxID=685778 RepID=UPI00035C94E6|nr:RloB domain-containing protein [Sphingomonas sp. PR090111-T3T-6A]
MRPQRRIVAQRRRLFVGCEGESEQAYVALLSRLAEAQRLSVHLDAVLLRPGGGDPLGLVELAVKKAAERERKHGRFDARFVLLDNDRLGAAPARDARIDPAIAQAHLQLIWQHTCHEALLLRHLEGCTQLRPASTQLAIAALEARWPTYRKGMAAARLADRIELAAIERVSQVEPGLAALLDVAGFL